VKINRARIVRELKSIGSGFVILALVAAAVLVLAFAYHFWTQIDGTSSCQKHVNQAAARGLDPDPSACGP
jgi:hypothetical protein